MSETERRVSHVEDGLPLLQVTTERLQHEHNSVLSKQDDMENRLRRLNLCFVGLLEWAEGSDPPTFLENLLTKTFGREAFSLTFVVERTHRLAGRAPLRTFIAKFRNYRDRSTFLWVTHKRGNISFVNVHIAMSPIFR